VCARERGEKSTRIRDGRLASPLTFHTHLCVLYYSTAKTAADAGRSKGARSKEPRSGNNKPRLATNQSADWETPYTARK